MRMYETVFVIDSLIKSEEINGIIEKIERIISNNGGKVVEIDRWGKKRLAYEIKKRQYGYYVDIYFEAPANLINILEVEYRLEENVLRYLTIHLNKRAVEYHEQLKLKKADTEDEHNNFNQLENDDEKEVVDEESEADVVSSGEDKKNMPVE